MGRASKAKAMARAARPRGSPEVLAALGRIDSWEASVDKEVPGWLASLDRWRAEQSVVWAGPEWCLVPMWVPYSLAKTAGATDLVRGIPGPAPTMAALYAWRQGKAIWQVDADLAEAVISSTGDDEIPVDVLYRLPEWGVYVLGPDCRGWPAEIVGAIAHLEWDPKTEQPELRLLLDYGEGRALGVPLPMTSASVTGMLKDVERAAVDNAKKVAVPVTPGGLVDMAAAISPVLALVLYLCSEGADISDPERPRAVPHRHKTPRVGPSRSWQVGYRIGAALRRAKYLYQAESAGGSSGRGVAPHLRRAHWHTYYTGEGSRRDPSCRVPVLRWLPPIPVGSEPETVLKRVR